MQKQQTPRNQQNPEVPERDSGMRQNDRRIDDPRVDEEREAPGAENAEDELDDEDFEGEENG